MGLKKNDIVCVYSPNIIEYPIIYMGVILAGGIASPANPGYTAEELAHQAKDSTSRFMVTIEPVLSIAKSACEAAKIPANRIIVLGKEVTSLSGVTSFKSLLNNSGEKVEISAVDSVEDVVVIPYSSGTTGLPKGVMLTHSNLVANILQLDALENGVFTTDDIFAGVLPFYHIFGMVVVLLGALYRGNTVVVHSKFELDKFLASIQQHKISVLHIVPPIVLALAKHPLVAKFDISSITNILCGAAPLGSDLCQELHTKYPAIKLRQGYGMTELSPVSHFQTEKDIVYGSIGELLINQECMTVDPDTGKSLPRGSTGEIWIRGPNVMKGYWRRPDATQATITEDGWLKTGDIGLLDDRDHYWIVDRLKELIKYKGFQVAPAELEALLLSHPDVVDVAVLGVPDEAGELPKAYIVLKPGAKATEKDIIEFAAAKSAPHKRLRGGVQFTQLIPKSASGKILRRILKAEEAKNRKPKAKL